LENNLSDPELKIAYRIAQTKKLSWLLSFYIGTNIGYLAIPAVNLIVTQFRDEHDSRVSFPAIYEAYPDEHRDDHRLDTNWQRLQRDLKFEAIHYSLLIIVAIVSIVLLQKTTWYFRVLPFVMVAMNVTTLPFFPGAFAVRIRCLQACAVFGTIYFNI